MFTRIALIAVLVGGCWCSESVAAESVPVKKPVPTHITSDKMTVRNQDQQAIFQNNVVLTKGPLIVHSDEMVVFYRDKKSKTGSDPQTSPSGKHAKDGMVNVDRILATGRVKIQREKGRASCHRAVYYLDEQKIVMTGNPKAWQEGNCVQGKKIIMFLAEDRTVVEGGSRVILDDISGCAE